MHTNRWLNHQGQSCRHSQQQSCYVRTSASCGRVQATASCVALYGRQLCIGNDDKTPPAAEPPGAPCQAHRRDSRHVRAVPMRDGSFTRLVLGFVEVPTGTYRIHMTDHLPLSSDSTLTRSMTRFIAVHTATEEHAQESKRATVTGAESSLPVR